MKLIQSSKTVVLLLSAIGILCGMSYSYAQEQPTRQQKAELLYDRMEYAKAAAFYEKILDTKKPDVADMERLANSYLYINQYDAAEDWFAKVVAMSAASKESLLNYAQVLKLKGKYQEAKEQYQKYAEKYGKDSTIRDAIMGVDSALVWMEHPTAYQIHNEETLNSANSEFSAFPTKRTVLYIGELDNRLIKKSGMTGRSYLRVLAAEPNTSGRWEKPAIMPGQFNQSSYHVGPVATNAQEDVFYVTATYVGNKEAERFSKNGQKWKRQNLALKIYTKDGDSWKEEDFPYNDVKQYSLGHAALSADEKTVYFASDMPGGWGGVDIWYSELQSDGSWGKPQNAGPNINTHGDEMFPNVQGDTLFFSSTGHVGMGGLDIFKAIGSKNTFKPAENLKYPVNSAADDFAFVLAKSVGKEQVGYFSSDRVGGQGADDIYSFTYVKPKATVHIEGLTQEMSTGKLLPLSTVTLFDGIDKRSIAQGQTDTVGTIRFAASENSTYKILGEKQGYYADSLSFSIPSIERDTTIKVVMNLQPVFKVGDRFVLEDIYYDFDKHFIRPDAALILDELVETMRKYPTLKIELSSHTDSRGSDAYNLNLSERRAIAAVNYIIGQGIDKRRLVARGYGETRLINKCSNGVACSDADHQANRRTEVEVLEF
ncbi:OmpA family protein [Sphingobacterium sp. SGG-5]|nr:OmpA family protein [Sphingobacterium sp. SGG-5]